MTALKDPTSPLRSAHFIERPGARSLQVPWRMRPAQEASNYPIERCRALRHRVHHHRHELPQTQAQLYKPSSGPTESSSSSSLTAAQNEQTSGSTLAVSRSFESLCRVLFTCRSHYLFAIGLPEVFSFGWLLPPYSGGTLKQPYSKVWRQAYR